MTQNSKSRYKPPTQERAIQTERAFLDAFDSLMAKNGYKNTTIDQIANEAGLTREAFMKRFGTKHQALLMLYQRYCEKASLVMTQIVASLPTCKSLDWLLMDMSSKLEELIRADFSSNRAMHEDFMDKLQVHELTQGIFRECVAMMSATQQRFLNDGEYSKEGAYAAAQLLVTINFNYVLKAMPGLPREGAKRHTIIAGLLKNVLNY